MHCLNFQLILALTVVRAFWVAVDVTAIFSEMWILLRDGNAPFTGHWKVDYCK